MIKTVKTEHDYKVALAEIENLIGLDPEPGTTNADRLEVLALLVRDYESKRFPVVAPDPIDAILFRMEQQDLKPRDLIPYIGSRSKVSEVLSRKRPLTLSMMRALRTGLGIPAEVLLQESGATALDELDFEWDRFPIREMIKRGWIKESIMSASTGVEKVLSQFFAELGTVEAAVALYRQSEHVRSARSMDSYSLLAWTTRVLTRALDNPPTANYNPGTVNLGFMRHLARLSVAESAPVLASEYLWDHGISLIVEPHLPRTHLDGASVLVHLDRPVIGLTLRHDRLDNFWFTLMHELAHVSLHLGKGTQKFYDDLDIESTDDPKEQEADALAGEVLIPEDAWRKSPASRLRSPEAAEHLAKQLNIHPAIVAGRMRHEFKAYRLFNTLVGHGQVRRLFREVRWEG